MALDVKQWRGKELGRLCSIVLGRTHQAGSEEHSSFMPSALWHFDVMLSILGNSMYEPINWCVICKYRTLKRCGFASEYEYYVNYVLWRDRG
jgi:hypothetical protein